MVHTVARSAFLSHPANRVVYVVYMHCKYSVQGSSIWTFMPLLSLLVKDDRLPLAVTLSIPL